MEATTRIIKIVRALDETKTRCEEQLFKAEGTKLVLDTLGHFRLVYLFTTASWEEEYPEVISRYGNKLIRLPNREMARVSSLRTPPSVVAVYELPTNEPIVPVNGLILAVDSVQDPGNLGTIIRACDWFGVRQIFRSPNSADPYSPKVIQSTMGAISRVKITTCNLASAIASLDDSLPIYGTFLDGENIYESNLDERGLIIMGNEGRGISKEITELVTRRLFIPPYPIGAQTSESLNVSVATGIILSEFRRRHF